ncbi:MAG: amino acid ABC transporter permease, partial [Chloroflexi bacterium]|nr:amino acid ABC transporter permease [Chloroflexota bacterium]
MTAVLGSADLLLQGTVLTIALAIGSLVLALLAGLFVAIFRLSPFKPLKLFGAAYVEFLRNIPLLVHMFFWVFGLPFIGIVLPEFAGALIGLSLYTSAFVAEAIRAGFLSIGHGQVEASRSLGLTYGQTVRLVLVPQALAVAMPPLGNLAIALTKNTSVASAVLVPELMHQAEVVNARTFATYETFVVTGALYLVLTIPLGRLT